MKHKAQTKASAFKVKLLEIALCNNATGVMQVLHLAGLRLREVDGGRSFQLYQRKEGE